MSQATRVLIRPMTRIRTDSRSIQARRIMQHRLRLSASGPSQAVMTMMDSRVVLDSAAIVRDSVVAATDPCAMAAGTAVIDCRMESAANVRMAMLTATAGKATDFR